MLIALISLLLGFVALVWSADRFLNGAAATAHNLGMAPLMIGLTIVSLGTSAPEILVALVAAIEGTPLLAVGNAIGSNIANIGLVLGFTAILVPLPFAGSVLRSEIPWMLAATAAAFIVLFDRSLNLLEGIFLLGMLAVLMYRLIRAQRSGEMEVPELEELEDIGKVQLREAVFMFVSGLVVLLISAEVIVWAATTIATELGVSELIIGLTVIAIGTSLPELAATVGSALKGHTDIAIGNVVGSNILNILAVLSLPGMVATVELGAAVLWRDYAMMLALTLLLTLFAYGINSRPVITRYEGFVLLASWVGYTSLLIIYQ